MTKTLFVFLFLVTGLMFAQTSTTQTKTPQHKSTTATHKAGTAARKPAARPNPNVPAKVTGPGTTTPSGLQYWDIRVGTGATAEAGQTVKVHYTGWLTTGKNSTVQ